MRLFLRNLSGATLTGGPETATHRQAQSFDGVDQVVTEFALLPERGPAGEVR